MKMKVFMQAHGVWEAIEPKDDDLCGPISPMTPAGNRYFLLLVDDFSRMMWVFMLKTKDEALSAFKKFKVLVKKMHAGDTSSQDGQGRRVLLKRILIIL